ncbi:MAG: DUF1501 domain-containing protein [Isosphaerales bacterium]
MPTRREILKASLNSAALVALAPTVPAFLARTARAAAPERDGRALVVVQLDGGNDAINTLVPFSDEGYARNRKVLRLQEKQLIRVNDRVGLHPALRDLGALLDRGHLALVPGVGYPNPNRSHFESMAIWQTARLDLEERGGPGWIGRGLDARAGTSAAAGPAAGTSALYVGEGTPPIALRGRRAGAMSLERIEDLTLPGGSCRSLMETPLETQAEVDDGLSAYVRRSVLAAYSSAERVAELTQRRGTGQDARYPETALAGRLRTVAQLLKADLGARVFYTIQSGYDTHAGQSNTHYQLLDELSSAAKAFLDDLTSSNLADRVTVLCFSEFGRRVAENSSAGTDHGTAGLVMLAGPGVRAGLHGNVPSLTELVDGDPKISTDFRRVYATVLEDWLGMPSRAALGSDFEPLPVFRSKSL